MLEAVIFGVNGTLADTERDGHRVAMVLKGRLHKRQYVDAALLATWLKTG